MTATVTSTEAPAGFVAGVRRVMGARVRAIGPFLSGPLDLRHLPFGKMLRSHLAARLVYRSARSSPPTGLGVIRDACVATELVHTASLCHDDVMDNGLIRRGRPALWRVAGASGAILIGDLLLCQAIDLLVHSSGRRHLGAFVAKVREVVAAEAEQEIALRGERLDEPTCLRLARGKTGPLFAFVGSVCGGDDRTLSAALEEAGYQIGTAYQLADDLLDVYGNEDAAGKTLGTDGKRHKLTLAQAPQQAVRVVPKLVWDLRGRALDCVADWPGVQEALREFFARDLQSVFKRHDGIRISV